MLISCLASYSYNNESGLININVKIKIMPNRDVLVIFWGMKPKPTYRWSDHAAGLGELPSPVGGCCFPVKPAGHLAQSSCFGVAQTVSPGWFFVFQAPLRNPPSPFVFTFPGRKHEAAVRGGGDALAAQDATSHRQVQKGKTSPAVCGALTSVMSS